MTYPQISVTGSVVKDSIDFRFSQGGKAFCRFRIKVSDRKKDGQNWTDAEPIWQSVVAFDKIAEHFADSAEAGDTVIVMGRLEPNVWTDKDGNERRDLNIVAAEIGMSCRWNSWTRDAESGGRSASAPTATSADPWASQASDEPPF